MPTDDVGAAQCDRPLMPRSHETFRSVLTVKLLGIMLGNRRWPTTFLTITAQMPTDGLGTAPCDQPSTRLVIRFIIIGLPGNDYCPWLRLCIRLWWGRATRLEKSEYPLLTPLVKKTGRKKEGSTLGWGERRREGRVKDCLNLRNVGVIPAVRCFCSPSSIDHVNLCLHIVLHKQFYDESPTKKESSISSLDIVEPKIDK